MVHIFDFVFDLGGVRNQGHRLLIWGPVMAFGNPVKKLVVASTPMGHTCQINNVVAFLGHIYIIFCLLLVDMQYLKIPFQMSTKLWLLPNYNSYLLPFFFLARELQLTDECKLSITIKSLLPLK